MDYTVEIQEINEQQMEIANKLLTANPQWCLLQGQKQTFMKIQEDMDNGHQTDTED
jgi:hypothetical protein